MGAGVIPRTPGQQGELQPHREVAAGLVYTTPRIVSHAGCGVSDIQDVAALAKLYRYRM